MRDLQGLFDRRPVTTYLRCLDDKIPGPPLSRCRVTKMEGPLARAPRQNARHECRRIRRPATVPALPS
jgi:hypothetical protein